jgi:hypothetical protein
MEKLKNMSMLDRGVRLVVSFTIFALILAEMITGVWAVITGVLAAVFALTSVFGFCPLYRPFGISTAKKAEEPRKKEK